MRWGFRAGGAVPAAVLGLGVAALAGCSSPAASSHEGDPSTTTSGSGQPHSMLVVGGTDTVGAACGGSTVSWVGMVRPALPSASIEVAASPGASFTARGTGGSSFTELTASKLTARTDSVVYFAGPEDASALLRLDDSADGALRAVRAVAPQAQVLVVGPVWDQIAAEPSTLPLVTSALQAAAERNGAQYLSADGWLRGNSDLVCSPGGGLSAEGERVVGRKIAEPLKLLLGS